MEQKQGNGLGIASLVIGIISLLLSCCYGGVIGVVGIILGIIAISKNNSQKGIAIGGIVTSAIAIAITVFMLILGVSVLDSVGDSSSDTPQKVSTTDSSNISGNSVDKKDDDTEKDDNTEKDNDTEKDDDTKKDDVNKEEATNGFKVGDVVETDTLRISFLSAKDYMSDNEFIQPEKGNKFIQAQFEFENIGESDEYISSYDFEAYADSYAIDQTYLDEDALDATLSKGKKTKGSVYFEVPEDTKEITIEYETNFWTESKIVFIVK